MRLQKKWLALPVMAAMLLTGCGGGAGRGAASGDALDFTTASGDAGNDLVVSVGTEEDKEVLKQITSDFKKDNPDFPYTVKAKVISEADGSVVAGVSGVWLSSDLQKAWGDNLAACKLPTYTVDGKQVQMASYAGYKMVGVNSFSAKADWANKFAAYMTNEKSQTLRFEKRGQGPSNKKAAETDEVKASPGIQALLAQSEYASLQRVGQKTGTLRQHSEAT